MIDDKTVYDGLSKQHRKILDKLEDDEDVQKIFTNIA